mmetsp:Transcript_66788/g.196018  ORF Transcript_66788/g.196018 Transcript_66788/m.196018 type:complete len:217 (+) Transcript_66788:800-1450(+)
MSRPDWKVGKSQSCTTVKRSQKQMTLTKAARATSVRPPTVLSSHLRWPLPELWMPRGTTTAATAATTQTSTTRSQPLRPSRYRFFSPFAQLGYLTWSWSTASVTMTIATRSAKTEQVCASLAKSFISMPMALESIGSPRASIRTFQTATPMRLVTPQVTAMTIQLPMLSANMKRRQRSRRRRWWICWRPMMQPASRQATTRTRRNSIRPPLFGQAV